MGVLAGIPAMERNGECSGSSDLLGCAINLLESRKVEVQELHSQRAAVLNASSILTEDNPAQMFGLMSFTWIDGEII